jgi:hypothetical protein
MEIWEWLMLIIASIAIVAILILVANKYFRIESVPSEIKGYKEHVIDSILDLVYKCYNQNLGNDKSVICYQGKINSNGEVLSSDILGKVDASKIDKNRIQADNLGNSAEIVIRYEKQIIYIEKVDYERIGT